MDKSIWTDGDFDQMSWHDVEVHAICFQQDDNRAEVLLDIDYVFRWIPPVPPGGYFMFEVSPATLVFEDIDDVEGSLEVPSVVHDNLYIEGIHRGEPDDATGEAGPRVPWHVDGSNFDLTFMATGYRQYVRARPRESDRMRMTSQQRGRVSFDRPEEMAELPPILTPAELEAARLSPAPTLRSRVGWRCTNPDCGLAGASETCWRCGTRCRPWDPTTLKYLSPEEERDAPQPPPEAPGRVRRPLAG